MSTDKEEFVRLLDIYIAKAGGDATKAAKLLSDHIEDQDGQDGSGTVDGLMEYVLEQFAKERPDLAVSPDVLAKELVRRLAKN
jgi:hypothetical protein